MKHSLDQLREVYTRVCGTCGYENFIKTPAGVRLERNDSQSSGFSHLNFAGDRIQLTEDHVGISIDQFSKKVRTVLQEAMPRLKIPIILVQQVTVRVTCTPNSFKNAGEFLARSIFRIRGEDLQLLGRPTSVHGFRLVFPATKEQPHAFNVRVESYLRDQQSVYIENVATFKTPIQINSLDKIEHNIELASEFVADHVVPFLSRYDRRDPE
jgi:hypothetical protein